jgi:outer membrane immunogenic protein
MKKFLLTTVAFGALAVPAMAADMAPAPYYKAPVPVVLPAWTGFYVGVNGGYGWSNGTVTETPYQNFSSAAVGLAGPVVPGATGNPKLDGAVFGVHGGYNWQTGAFVLGVEGDWDAAGLNNSTQGVFSDPTTAPSDATDGLMVHQDIQWLATVRGRLGYTWGSSMVYATGGGAWESLRTNVLLSTNTAAFGATSAAASFTNTRSGYAVGAGYEWMINPNWIARVEYLHYGFGDSGNTFGLPVSCGIVAGGACGGNFASSNNSIDTVRAALSYKFW